MKLVRRVKTIAKGKSSGGAPRVIDTRLNCLHPLFFHAFFRGDEEEAAEEEQDDEQADDEEDADNEKKKKGKFAFSVGVFLWKRHPLDGLHLVFSSQC